MCEFSIITVCKNAQDTLKKAIDSVVNQTFSDWEYIFVDALSSDNTVEIIEKIAQTDKRIHFISEADNGIYDAMNKAISLATGEYLYFLGADDELYNQDVLFNVYKNIKNMHFPDIIYGDVVFIDSKNTRIVKKYGSANTLSLINLSLQKGTCHQAVFAKKELFNNNKFSLEHTYNADEVWLARCLKNGARAIGIDVIIAYFYINGFSSSILYTDAGYKSVDELAKEACFVLYVLQKPLKYVLRNIRKLIMNRK